MPDSENQGKEENLGQEVDSLLEQGLSQKEIEARGYSPSLVRQRIRKRVKAGKGPPVSSGRDGTLAVRKTGESVLPEWLETDIAQIFDGEVRDQRIFMAGMSVPMMGLRLFTEGVKPIIDLMATWQKGQAEAAQAAQGSVVEAAQVAGQAAAMGVGKYFEETKPWLAAAPNPLMATMANAMQPLFNQAMGNLMTYFTRLTPQGQLGTQPPQSAQLGVQPPTPQPGFQPPGQQASEKEVEEAFE